MSGFKNFLKNRFGMGEIGIVIAQLLISLYIWIMIIIGLIIRKCLERRLLNWAKLATIVCVHLFFFSFEDIKADANWALLGGGGD